MNGEERRSRIVRILSTSEKPVSGTDLAKSLAVSRQVIVQDMAIIRANGLDVIATNRGYILHSVSEFQRVYKVWHDDSQMEQELLDIVDVGGKVKDVFVYHKVYGIIRAELNLASRRDVENYMNQIRAGLSAPLKNVTAGYHYHTIQAENEAILDLVWDKLQEDGFLAKLQDYEPVDFWGEKNIE